MTVRMWLIGLSVGATVILAVTALTVRLLAHQTIDREPTTKGTTNGDN